MTWYALNTDGLKARSVLATHTRCLCIASAPCRAGRHQHQTTCPPPFGASSNDYMLYKHRTDGWLSHRRQQLHLHQVHKLTSAYTVSDLPHPDTCQSQIHRTAGKPKPLGSLLAPAIEIYPPYTVCKSLDQAAPGSSFQRKKHMQQPPTTTHCAARRGMCLPRT